MNSKDIDLEMFHTNSSSSEKDEWDSEAPLAGGHEKQTNKKDLTVMILVSGVSCLITGSNDGQIHKWDLLSGIKLKSSKVATDRITCIKMGLGDNHLYVGSSDRMVYRVHLNKFKVGMDYGKHKATVTGLHLTKSKLITGMKHIIVWDVCGGLQLYQISMGGTVRDFYFYHGQIYTGDRQICGYDVANGQKNQASVFETLSYRLRWIAVKEGYVFGGIRDHGLSCVYSWDIKTKRRYKTYSQPKNVSRFVLEDGWLFMGCEDGTVFQFDLRQESAKYTYDDHKDEIVDIQIKVERNDSRKLFTASKDGTLIIYDFKPGEPAKLKYTVVHGEYSPIQAFSLFRSHIYTLGQDNVVVRWLAGYEGGFERAPVMSREFRAPTWLEQIKPWICFFSDHFTMLSVAFIRDGQDDIFPGASEGATKGIFKVSTDFMNIKIFRTSVEIMIKWAFSVILLGFLSAMVMSSSLRARYEGNNIIWGACFCLSTGLFLSLYRALLSPFDCGSESVLFTENSCFTRWHICVCLVSFITAVTSTIAAMRIRGSDGDLERLGKKQWYNWKDDARKSHVGHFLAPHGSKRFLRVYCVLRIIYDTISFFLLSYASHDITRFVLPFLFIVAITILLTLTFKWPSPFVLHSATQLNRSFLLVIVWTNLCSIWASGMKALDLWKYMFICIYIAGIPMFYFFGGQLEYFHLILRSKIFPGAEFYHMRDPNQSFQRVFTNT